MLLSHKYATALPETVSKVTPQTLDGIALQLHNTDLAKQFNLPAGKELMTAIFSPDGKLAANAVAQKYGGHQFGHWNPQLGDGRGLLLGEVTDENGQSFDLHLKGAGQTPYSRHADGRAVLRSTLREYIASEALHHLGIPTSRALCLMTSQHSILREQLEPGAMMIRMAPSHLRFGHFEYYFHSRQPDILDKLMNYTLANHLPECRQQANPHKALLTAITLRTARMIALWQAHGFVHGVMNTDNMSIHGITFDYGPYAFLEHFKSDAVFNHSDYEGRYAFDRQPGIALWNLNALAHTFTDYLSTDDIRACLARFEPTFLSQYRHQMFSRMGLDDNDDNEPCLQQWLALLEQNTLDYTHSFRQLATADPNEKHTPLRDHVIDREAFDNWWQNYRQRRISSSQDKSKQLLTTLNPAVIPRTHYLQNAIDAAEQGDFGPAEALIAAIKQPFEDNPATRDFQQPGKQSSEVSLSCSS
ncbi:protein adenylyltransferase SelO [Alteromonas gilva]|uniref:Protein nucleotidyltransferase YdiU n=1 Tax=Alteromonas gilva TaxID=2987522 RepID=A0ABT5KZG7_9ALTE|nr:YdiU family protein [Alteromonas gilva]MDC8829596.1 YdiU family protein [Alteromonas gilva]